MKIAMSLFLSVVFALVLSGCSTQYPDGSHYAAGNWTVIKINGHNYIEYFGMVPGLVHDPDCPYDNGKK